MATVTGTGGALAAPAMSTTGATASDAGSTAAVSVVTAPAGAEAAPGGVMGTGAAGVPAAGGLQVLQKLALMNESTWVRMGALAERMGNTEQALQCYQSALRHNPNSTKALSQAAGIYRTREDHKEAAELYKRLLQLEPSNGETWGALGHCALLLGELQQAYQAYQQALLCLNNPKDPQLWYGIGILYERYGSYENAEEAFGAVLNMAPNFEKRSEVYYRLGTIYKAQGKAQDALDCFQRVLSCPPPPLSVGDIFYQCALVYESQNEPGSAEEMYRRVLAEQPRNAKVLQSFGWLLLTGPQAKTDDAIATLTRAVESDPNDPVGHYLLGRAYMTLQHFKKAYDSYQQAVYKDAKNPAFWCSIGVLYFLIGQYRDSLDAFTRAIRIGDTVPEVWYNLGSLYEACNQFKDSLDAFQHAAELDPTNEHTRTRMDAIRALTPEQQNTRAPAKEGEPPTIPTDSGAPLTIEPRVALNTSQQLGQARAQALAQARAQQLQQIQQLQLQQQQQQQQQEQQVRTEPQVKTEMTDETRAPQQPPATPQRQEESAEDSTQQEDKSTAQKNALEQQEEQSAKALDSLCSAAASSEQTSKDGEKRTANERPENTDPNPTKRPRTA